VRPCLSSLSHSLCQHSAVCAGADSCLSLPFVSQPLTAGADSCLLSMRSGDPYQYVRTGSYATILAKEASVATAAHSGAWQEPFLRKGAGIKKAARVIYW